MFTKRFGTQRYDDEYGSHEPKVHVAQRRKICQDSSGFGLCVQ